MKKNDFDLRKILSDTQLFNIIYKGNTDIKRQLSRGAIAPKSIIKICKSKIADLEPILSNAEISSNVVSVYSDFYDHVHILDVWINRDEWNLFSDLLVKVIHPQTGKRCWGFTNQAVFSNRLNSLPKTKTYASLMRKVYRSTIHSAVTSEIDSLSCEVAKEYERVQDETDELGHNFIGQVASGKLYFENISGYGIHVRTSLYLIGDAHIWKMSRIGASAQYVKAKTPIAPPPGMIMSAASNGFSAPGTTGEAIANISSSMHSATAVSRTPESHLLEFLIPANLFEIKSRDVRKISWEDLKMPKNGDDSDNG